MKTDIFRWREESEKSTVYFFGSSPRRKNPLPSFLWRSCLFQGIPHSQPFRCAFLSALFAFSPPHGNPYISCPGFTEDNEPYALTQSQQHIPTFRGALCVLPPFMGWVALCHKQKAGRYQEPLHLPCARNTQPRQFNIILNYIRLRWLKRYILCIGLYNLKYYIKLLLRPAHIVN